MDVLAHNVDRPERMDIIGTRDKGLIGRVFSYSMTVNRDKFPSCNQYKQKQRVKLLQWNKNQNIQIRTTKHVCLKCYNWNLEGITNLFEDNFQVISIILKTSNSPPLCTRRKAGVKYLVPFQQDFSKLIMTVNVAYFNMAKNHWKLSINSSGDVTNCVL